MPYLKSSELMDRLAVLESARHLNQIDSTTYYRHLALLMHHMCTLGA